MKKLSLVFYVGWLLFFGLAGCSSTPKAIKPVVKTTEQFKIEDISVKVTQLVTPDIVYHTEDEIRDLVVADIKKNLEEDNLLSTNDEMNSLNIKIIYQRRFVGDETPIPSDSLAYPIFDYDIEVKNGDEVLTTITRKDLHFSGGLSMNLKVLGGLLREKSDEIVFVEALSHFVRESIKELKE